MSSSFALECGARSVMSSRARRCLFQTYPNTRALTSLSSSVMSSTAALVTARRSYYHFIPENLVAPGAKTDALHSSSVPSERMRVIKEYALGPLFGSRRAVCYLGSTLPRKRLMEYKVEVPAVLASLLDVDVADIELGSIEMLQDRVLLRKGDALCPRVSPVDGHRVADSFIPVYLREDSLLAEEDGQALGEVLLAMFQLGEAKRLEELGISLIELDAEDVSDYNFFTIGGEQVADEELESISNRWEKRLQREGAAAPKANI